MNGYTWLYIYAGGTLENMEMVQVDTQDPVFCHFAIKIMVNAITENKDHGRSTILISK